jgi:hypothetical protein
MTITCVHCFLFGGLLLENLFCRPALFLVVVRMLVLRMFDHQDEVFLFPFYVRILDVFMHLIVQRLGVINIFTILIYFLY